MAEGGDKPPSKREQDRERSRTAILDATEAIMRESGYPAVTSRHVAERAGVKPQLVHYHFGSMDTLLQELFKRNEARYFAQHMHALDDPQPLDALWSLNTESAGMDVVGEFVAAAHHREILKKELAETRRKFRQLHAAKFDRYFEANGIDTRGLSSSALSFVFSSIAMMLVEERRLGLTESHDEVLVFIRRLIASLAPGATADAPIALTDGTLPGCASSGPDELALERRE